MNSEEQPNPLSDDEARQLAEHLSVVTQSGRPLAPALRAAAEELPNRRLADALERLDAIWNRGNRSRPFWKRIRGFCRRTCDD